MPEPFGVKLPKIGKVKIKTKEVPLTGTIAPTFFESFGYLYITENFSGEELTVSNIRGLCAFVDIGAGLIAGCSGVGMLLNLSPWLLPMASNPALAPIFFGSADAVLLMRGPNVGIQAGIGGAAFLGGLV